MYARNLFEQSVYPPLSFGPSPTSSFLSALSVLFAKRIPPQLFISRHLRTLPFFIPALKPAPSAISALFRKNRGRGAVIPNFSPRLLAVNCRLETVNSYALLPRLPQLNRIAFRVMYPREAAVGILLLVDLHRDTC